MPSSNDASSTLSHSTTMSHAKDHDAAAMKPSFRQRVKNVLRDLGNPPTYRYDLAHPEQAKKSDYAYGLNSTGPFPYRSPSRL